MVKIFRVFVPASVIGLVLSEFIIVFFCYVGASFLLARLINPEFSPIIFFESESGSLRIVAVVVSIVAAIYFQNLYTDFRVKSLMRLLEQLCMALGVGFLIQAVFTYLKRPDLAIPKWTMIFGSILTLLTIPAWRLFYGSVILKALGTRRILFLGTSPVVRDIAQKIADRAEVGMSILGLSLIHI